MATGLDLSGIQQFNPHEDPASLSNRWKAWLKRFQRFVVAMDIKDETRKRSLLLYLAGPEVEKIFETIPNNGEEKDFDAAATKLTEYFAPKKNVMYETHVFRKAQQHQGETLDQFYTRLCQLAKTCEFSDDKQEIKIQLIEGCSSTRVRRKALREDISLDTLLKYGRALETSDQQAHELEKAKSDQPEQSEQVNFFNENASKNRSFKPKGARPNEKPQRCFNCGGSYPHTGGKASCPAFGKTCRGCGRRGHFQAVCRSQNTSNRAAFDNEQHRVRKRINRLRVKDEDKQSATREPSTSSCSSGSEIDNEYSFAVLNHPTVMNTDVASVANTKSLPQARVKIGETSFSVLVDSGATINILDPRDFSKILHRRSISLKPTRTKIKAFGSDRPIELSGKFEVVVESKKRLTVATFYVTKQECGSLLSCDTSVELGLIQFASSVSKPGLRNKNQPKDTRAVNGNKKESKKAPKVKANRANTKETNQVLKAKEKPARIPEVMKPDVNNANCKHAFKLRAKYPSVFEGIGKLNDFEQKLHIDESVPPVSQTYRRTPFHLRKQLDSWLEDYQSKGIIEPVVDESTDWVSGLVVAPKPHNPKEVRVCGDYRRVNEAIKRERHPIPTVDELLEEMAGATIFSKIDLRAGYHQILLAEESRSITTFVTHRGLFRFKRLPFGINSASEVFQNAIQNALRGLQGTRNIADDVILWATSKEEHDERLNALFQRLHDKGLTVNTDKCLFGQPSLWFYGYTLGQDGLKADKKKIEAIQHTSIPKNITQLRSFLGLANYCSRFIHDFATITSPLRHLTQKGVPWSWTQAQQKAFEEVKAAISQDCIMAYYDPTKKTRLTVDASPYGLGAILSNVESDGTVRNVAYASRSLSPTEQRYSQTEREALAVVWGCERFHMYLIGAKFELITDHKALEVIFSPKSKPPARIERWGLRLQQYEFKVIYRKGSENPADVLSRMPLPSQQSNPNVADEYVNFVAQHAVPKAMTLQEIAQSTQNDQELQAVTNAIQSNHWSTSPTLAPFTNIRNELAVTTEGVILRGHRIVMPQSLRERTLAIVHAGHQGIIKTKQLLRTKTWWPKIDQDVESLIKKCLACQAVGPANPTTPLGNTEIPSKPWSSLHIDLCGPFPTGESVLVVIDAYSRFPEVDILKSTTATSIISKLERIFSIHGLPDSITSDNGPQFISQELASYLVSNGVKHHRVTPLWPQANGMVESFMKPLNKAIRTAHAQGQSWQKELPKFLLNYRTTPHTTTNVAPSQLLFNRVVRNGLPTPPNLPPVDQRQHSKAQHCDRERKKKCKEYVDKKRRAKEPNINMGDIVLIKQEKQNKFSTRFNPNPYKVVAIKAHMVTAARSGHQVTRHVSYFKKFEGEVNMKEIEDNGSDKEEVMSEATTPDFVPEDMPAGAELERRYPMRDRQQTKFYTG